MYSVSRSCLLQSVFRKAVYSPITSSQTRLVTLKPYIGDSTENLSFVQRNEALKRPLSPHLSIYKLQMTSAMSISHRITGVAIGVYSFGLIAFVIGPYDVLDATEFIKSLELSAFTVIAIKSALALPFAYHYANGIRHLIWDTGKMLTNQGVIKSGYFVLLLTALLTAGLLTL